MGTLTIHGEKAQLKILKGIAKVLGLTFEEEEKQQLPQHVLDGLKKSQKDFEEGRFKKYTGIDDLFAK